VREIAVGALIDADHPGKLVLVGPAADAGPLARAAGAGLENLARTLSVEWARHRVTSVMVSPGPGSTAASLSTLVGFLVSEAGDYLSGCRVELGTGR
jgi:NAD(P)-dependent dehydrogenase (short-subunit alcohol dehydrogenase family)